MRNQASSWVSLVTVGGITVAGFLGACGGKVVVDGSNPSGAGGAGGASDSIVATSGVQTTSGPETTTGPITTGPNPTGPSTTSGPITTGATMVVAVSVGPGASSSTGGINPCDDACTKSSMCGFDFCSQFNINCANPPPPAQCPLKCIAVASCGDIAKLAMQNFATPLGACLFNCQGMGPSGGGP